MRVFISTTVLVYLICFYEEFSEAKVVTVHPNVLEEDSSTNNVTILPTLKNITSSEFSNWDNLQELILQSFNSGDRKSFEGNGTKSWESKLYSIVSSTAGLSVTDMLEKIKRKMLNNIHTKAEDVFKSRGDGHGHGGHHGHGGIGFPSLEAALLSLAFLTFAVFLIDLIQQLIARYRAGVSTPTMTMGMGMGRQKRDVSEYLGNPYREFSTLTSVILNSIENPLFANRYNRM